MGMGQRGIPAGEWSKATAYYFEALIVAKNKSRNQVRKDLNISKGRLPELLSGKRPWYLEDVELFCNYFNIDFKKFLKDVEKGVVKPLSVIDSSIADVSQNAYGLVADHQDGKIGTETDEGFDSP